MSLPEVLRHDVENLMCEFCLMSLAESPRIEYHLAFRIRDSSVTRLESYPARGRHPKDWTRVPSARFRYDLEQQVWIPYRADGSGRWRLCNGVQPSSGLPSLRAKLYSD